MPSSITRLLRLGLQFVNFYSQAKISLTRAYRPPNREKGLYKKCGEGDADTYYKHIKLAFITILVMK